MRVYLDTCCYGRPSDDLTQEKIAEEAAAVMAVIETCRALGHVVIGGTVVRSEIEGIPDAVKRRGQEAFFEGVVGEYFTVTALDAERARELGMSGLGAMDSFHLASAEAAGADVLLTTDAPFISVCARRKLSVVRVMNPLKFWQEAL